MTLCRAAGKPFAKRKNLFSRKVKQYTSRFEVEHRKGTADKSQCGKRMSVGLTLTIIESYPLSN